MDHDLLKIEFLAEGIVRLVPGGNIEDISLLPAVLSAFEKELRKQHIHFVFDARELPFLPPSWIVLIYEMTARARRRGGNLCVINLLERALNDLNHFHPDSYLCFEENELMPAVHGAPFGVPEEAAAEAQMAVQNRGRQDEDSVGEVQIPSRVDMLYRACDFVLEIAQKMGFPESELSKIKISVYEGCLNAIEHAYHSDPTHVVKVQVSYNRVRLIIRIIDHGDGFEVRSDAEFDAAAAAAARKTGGMGLHIIRRSMDSVHYVRNRELGNMLIMEKRLQTMNTTAHDSSTGIR